MGLFISDAMAQASGMAPQAGQQASGFSMLVMPLIFIVIFYFLLWRPQSKRAKEQREMISSIKKGDEIVTTGGMLGKVQDVKESYLDVLIADGIAIKLQKAAVNTILPKGTMKTI